MNNHLIILGIRGVPAAHGGFETFAEQLSCYLLSRGWDVTVYCQECGNGPVYEDVWRGVRRIIVPVVRQGAWGTIEFDWRCISHLISAPKKGLVLTLGYNTAAFSSRLRLSGFVNLFNMDGLEWKRDKWRLPERIWLWINERAGCWFGNHLIADHPEIAKHLALRAPSEKITMIPYGASDIQSAKLSDIQQLGLEPDRYLIVIARPEPENSVLEIVRAFSRVRRGIKLLMLGNYQPTENLYHKQVFDHASEEVIFPGAIYEKNIVDALRLYCRFYIHGHKVGGTNPSLVEALGAGSAVLAHDNVFNRWVVGNDGCYFASEDECAEQIENLLADDKLLERLRKESKFRFKERFTWEMVLSDYERLLLSWVNGVKGGP